MTDYGVYSARWLLTQALKHVPREDLDRAIATMLYYMEKAENVTVPRAFDVLGQVAFTGAYVPPEVYMQPEEEPEIQDPEAPPINESDIATFLEGVAEWPEAEDPHEEFKL